MKEIGNIIKQKQEKNNYEIKICFNPLHPRYQRAILTNDELDFSVQKTSRHSTQKTDNIQLFSIFR